MEQSEKIQPFELERYFAKYEFSTRYLLSSSDCDGLSMTDVLGMADFESRKLWDELKLGYTESSGLPLLREEIAKLYQYVDADDVLVVTPEEGIFVAVNALLGRGDHVICSYPGYQSLYAIAESIGCEVERWEPVESENWRFNVEVLSKRIRSNTKFMIINFPHNPTGYLPSIEDYQYIVNLAKDHEICLFSDEMYRLLEYKPEERLLPVASLYENGISLFGMSKTFGMAGVRIGWLVTRNKKLYQKMASFKDYTTICSSAPSEILSLIALRGKDLIVEKHLKRIQRNLGVLAH